MVILILFGESKMGRVNAANSQPIFNSFINDCKKTFEAELKAMSDMSNQMKNGFDSGVSRSKAVTNQVIGEFNAVVIETVLGKAKPVLAPTYFKKK
jgi:hypothetical protein